METRVRDRRPRSRMDRLVDLVGVGLILALLVLPWIVLDAVLLVSLLVK